MSDLRLDMSRVEIDRLFTHHILSWLPERSMLTASHRIPFIRNGYLCSSISSFLRV